MNSGSVKTKDEAPSPDNEASWAVALSQMEEALRLLDENDAPPQIGAQLDLAIQQLKDEIGRPEAK